MIITRMGKNQSMEYLLTRSEMEKAYREQQAVYDTGDVKSCLANLAENTEDIVAADVYENMRSDPDVVTLIAQLYRKFFEEDGKEYETFIQRAIDAVAQMYRSSKIK